MKFEEALTLMRQGKKITHSSLGENVYFQACRIGFMFDETPLEERPISIVKMFGDRQHPDMGTAGSIDDMLYPGTLIVKPEVFKEPCKHGHFPQLNLFLVMADDWEEWMNRKQVEI
jgi:hypothetical protein